MAVKASIIAQHSFFVGAVLPICAALNAAPAVAGLAGAVAASGTVALAYTAAAAAAASPVE